MNKTKHPPITIRMIIIAIVLMFAYSCECPAQTPSPSPVPTPADDDAKGWFGVIQESPDREYKISGYWSPVTTRKGWYEEPRTYYFWSDDYGKAVQVEREYSEGLRSGVLHGLRPLGWAVYEFEEIELVRSNAGGGNEIDPGDNKKPDGITDIKPGSGQKPGNDYVKMKAVKKHSAILIQLPEKFTPGRTPWKNVYGKPVESEMWVKQKGVAK